MSDQPGNGERTDRAIRASAAYQQILDWQKNYEEKAEERHREVMAAIGHLNSNPAIAVGRVFHGSYRLLVAAAALSGVLWLYLMAQQALAGLRGQHH